MVTGKDDVMGYSFWSERSEMSKTARIRQLLKDKPLVVAMGAWDAVR